MTPEQETKNRRVETDIMGVSLPDEPSKCPECRGRGIVGNLDMLCSDCMGQGIDFKTVPRDFCNSRDLCCDVMQPQLIELGLQVDFGMQCVSSALAGIWLHLIFLSAEARVDAALSAWDASREGEI